MTRCTLAIPSKGRLQEQTADWLSAAGLPLHRAGQDRGYSASLGGGVAMEVQLVSAREIARGLHQSEYHLGITGLDLLSETEIVDSKAFSLMPLGFGRADLVVAVPQAWIDVVTMADLDAVADDLQARTGRPLRVATKYHRNTRRFFARHGISHYRIVDSQGATEGAPASGQADVIVDITTTGNTLRANHLRALEDGTILSSEAHLIAAPGAEWSTGARQATHTLLDRVEARERARRLVVVLTDVDVATARVALSELDARYHEGLGWLISSGDSGEAADRLRLAGAGLVAVSRAEFLHAGHSEAFDRLQSALSAISG